MKQPEARVWCGGMSARSPLLSKYIDRLATDGHDNCWFEIGTSEAGPCDAQKGTMGYGLHAYTRKLFEMHNCRGGRRAVLNDSYQTRVLLQHPPHVVAIACIVLVSLRTWWTVMSSQICFQHHGQHL